jgi:UTP-glucose-1-phosphate uridylyltransferase
MAPYFGNCGRVEGTPLHDGSVYRLTRLHGKRKGSFDLAGQEEALRTTGKYILFPEFLDVLEEMRGRIEGEIDDVPVVQELVARDRVCGVKLKGVLFDVGNWAGFAAANHYWGARQGLWKSHF